jgi:hypothetical protein
MTRPCISLTILAPEGASLPDVVKAVLGSYATGYDISSLSVDVSPTDYTAPRPLIVQSGLALVPAGSPALVEPAAATEPAKPAARRGRPPKGEAAPVDASQASTVPATEPPAEPAPDHEPTPETAEPSVSSDSPAESEPTAYTGPVIGVDELREAARELIQSKRGGKVRVILDKVGADSLSDVPVAQRLAVLDELRLAAVE